MQNIAKLHLTFAKVSRTAAVSSAEIVRDAEYANICHIQNWFEMQHCTSEQRSVLMACRKFQCQEVKNKREAGMKIHEIVKSHFFEVSSMKTQREYREAQLSSPTASGYG